MGLICFLVYILILILLCSRYWKSPSCVVVFTENFCFTLTWITIVLTLVGDKHAMATAVVSFELRMGTSQLWLSVFFQILFLDSKGDFAYLIVFPLILIHVFLFLLNTCICLFLSFSVTHAEIAVCFFLKAQGVQCLCNTWLISEEYIPLKQVFSFSS